VPFRLASGKEFLKRANSLLEFLLQASPNDPDNFPFVLLGNKVDQDEGRSRVVRTLFMLTMMMIVIHLQISSPKTASVA
jgi:GTPase SAR1 family protein